MKEVFHYYLRMDVKNYNYLYNLYFLISNVFDIFEISFPYEEYKSCNYLGEDFVYI